MIKIKRKVRTKRNLTSSNLSKNIIRKRNPNIFHFNNDSSFIYESCHCSFFYGKLIDRNHMKPSNEDITFLKDYENNFNCSNDENQKSDFFWPQKFANYFQI